MLGFVPVASAKNWPLPAAGPSVSGDPELILTFDDGPSPTNTPKVLDILAKHHLKVIFFMVGEMAGSANRKVPAIIERIRREGHIIGTHTMTHQNLCKVNADRAAKERFPRELVSLIWNYIIGVRSCRSSTQSSQTSWS